MGKLNFQPRRHIVGAQRQPARGRTVAAELVAFIERLFGFQVLPAGVYFINYLPSDLHLSDVVTIGITACLLAFAATIYPSLSASRVRPRSSERTPSP